MRRSALPSAAAFVLLTSCVEQASGPSPNKQIADGSRPALENTPVLLEQVTKFFAPVIYQRHSKAYKYDFLTKATFDGDWQGTNNWDHAYNYPMPGYVYASIIEDANRYFIHYGTFHARDYCLGSDGGAAWPECKLDDIEPRLPCCWSYHENDMEGVTIVVDKRWATTAWPFGQIVTAQTIYHTAYPIYKNCQMEPPAGGSPVEAYVEAEYSFSWPYMGCIPFRANAPVGTSPSAWTRFQLDIDYGGHAVSLGDRPWNYGPGYGVLEYFPTDSAAWVPQVQVTGYSGGEPLFWSAPTPYKIQLINEPELGIQSFWDMRGAQNNVLFTYYQTVFPQNAAWLTRFIGNEGALNSPKPPWAQSGGLTILGDWHNHPSWAWRSIWKPAGPLAPIYYDYCRASACRYPHEYLFNPYWIPLTGPPPPFNLGFTGPTEVGPNTRTCSTWSATPQNGTQPYSYEWFGLFTSDQPSVTGTVPTEGGDIAVIVSDADGRSRSMSIHISYNPNDLSYCE